MTVPLAHPFAVDVRRCRTNGSFSWSIRKRGKVCDRSQFPYNDFEEARLAMVAALGVLIAAPETIR